MLCKDSTRLFFLFQNVLRQMGLNVVSVDGVVIHETKTWIKRCYACFKTVPDVSKEFCPKCGNQTLKRVSVSLNADGTTKIHISGKFWSCRQQQQHIG